MDKEEKYRILERVDYWTSNCDTKSSFLLATIGIVSTILFTTTTKDYFKATLQLNSTNELNLVSVGLFVELVLLFLFIYYKIRSLFFIYSVLKARISPEVYSEIDIEHDSVLFFGSVSKKKYADFKIKVNSITDAELLNDIDSQIYINSKITCEKFNHYNKSISAILRATIFLTVYLIFVFINA